MSRDIFYAAPDGLTLYAEDRGPEDAPVAVLCLHGLTRNHKDFGPMINALDAPYRFISPDVRGRGRSQRASDPATYTPVTYAADMIALIDHLGLSQVALVGTSMGGLISMILMRKHAARIAGVVLNDVGPVLEPAGLSRIANYVGQVAPLDSWGAAQAAVAAAQSGVYPHYGPEDWAAFAERTYRETDDGRVILDYDPDITRTVGDVKPTWRTRFLMWRLFSSMKARPLLILRGETSDILSDAVARRMVRRHPDATYVTVTGVGHAPMLDEPASIQALQAFLARLAGANSA